ncbi:MAG TPA: SoxR reducing system RseC family protein [Bacteroidales bacterium]|jgi:positive regulator of sigma E activity|nr:SoxR reducing system RseC family protein [Bacteroidales bacterium]
MKNIIDHPGIVKEIRDKKTLIVSIISTSACNHCSSKEACSLSLSSEVKEKEVEVSVQNADDYKPGQSVMVVMNQKNGILAVVLGYIVPLFLLLASVFVVYGVSHNEAWAGLSGLLILVPYYLALYFLNSRIKKQFQFRLK